MGVNEIRNAKFEVAFRGYKPEEVDAFLESTARELEKAYADREDMEKKLKILAAKIEDYRDEEETLKLAMLNAQRMGESILKEAKLKAEEIIREANIVAEDREQRANDEVARASNEMVQMQKEVSHFKANVLNLYKKHIESLSALQSYEEAPEREIARRNAFAGASTPDLADDIDKVVNFEPAVPPMDEPEVEPVIEPIAAVEPEKKIQFDAPEEPVKAAEPVTELPAPEMEPLPNIDLADTIEAIPSMASLIDVSQEIPAQALANDLVQDDDLPSVFGGFKGISFYD